MVFHSVSEEIGGKGYIFSIKISIPVSGVLIFSGSCKSLQE